MKIWGNMIVYNEEHYIWYSLMSVINYLDKILVWDTGSTDKTVELIKSIDRKYPGKILFKQVGQVDSVKFTLIRQQMLEHSKCDWIVLVDGDEVWWNNSICKLVKIIKSTSPSISAIVVKFINLVGDIYHCQSETYGHYRIHGKIGHITIRAINRKIKGLHVDKPFGFEGYYNDQGLVIQDLPQDEIIFTDCTYLHFTHLKRSSKTQKYDKFKYQLGEELPDDFQFPEILNRKSPLRYDVWAKRSSSYLLCGLLNWPLQLLKRII